MRRQFGAPALIVYLLHLLGCDNSQIDQRIQDLSHPDAAIRRTAIASLAEIESPSEEVFAAIRTAITDQDREVRRIAVTAIGKADHSEQQTLLEQALDDSALAVRMASAYALLRLDSQHPAAQEVLITAMKLGDGGVIVAIGREKSTWAVPTLIELLRDPRPGTRRLAAESLGKIGPAAIDALPTLERASLDPNDRVRAAAITAKTAIEHSIP